MYDVITVKPFMLYLSKSGRIENYKDHSKDLLLDYRDVQVYKTIACDYVYNGVTIMRRVGVTKESSKDLIDQFHDGNKENRTKNLHNHILPQENYKRGIELKNKFS